MKTILIIGAGRSTSAMINYLEKQAFNYHWKIVVADKETEHLKNIVNDIAIRTIPRTRPSAQANPAKPVPRWL